jgi:hypothetical protein
VALSTGERVTIGPFGVVRFFVLTGYLLYRGVKVSFRIPGGVIGTGPRSSIDRDTAVAASSLVGCLMTGQDRTTDECGRSEERLESPSRIPRGSLPNRIRLRVGHEKVSEKEIWGGGRAADIICSQV